MHRYSAERIHILVVDDEESIRDIMQRAIKDAGYTCTIAENTQEALKVLEEKNIDVVITDASKPFPFTDGTFDFVIANQVIEHVTDTDTFIKEVYRILRPGGVCICSTPNLASFHNIFCLILGYQPFTSHVSDKKEDCGTLFSSTFPSTSILTLRTCTRHAKQQAASLNRLKRLP